MPVTRRRSGGGGSPANGYVPDMTGERASNDRPDAAGERPDDETIPAEQTAEGMGDVEIGGESEEDAPTGGLADP
jgi:hypothetical protein